MKLARLLLLPVLLGTTSSLAAQNDEVERGPEASWVDRTEPLPVPEDADGAFFVRRQDTLAHLSPDGQHFYYGQLIRVLQAQALQIGNVSLTWNPASGTPTVHEIKIHRDGTVIDVLANTEFEILRREDQLETAMLDGMLTAVMRVPDLRVGDDLEYAFTIPSHDPTFRETNFGALFLSHSPPSGRVRIGLSWEQGEEPQTHLTPDLESLAEITDRSIMVDVDNLEAITAPNSAPPRYSWMRILQYTDFKSWEDLSSQFHELYRQGSALSDNSTLKDEAARIANAHSSDKDRAAAALKLVQQQVRYVYVGLNGGNQTPVSADETWSRRYGDCKGKTVMLLALLNELEIEAEPVLVDNSAGDDGLDTRLPSPGNFDHVLVRATIDGTEYWMDGTLPAVIEARDEPFLPYRWVLPLTKAGSTLEAVKHGPLQLPQTMGIVEIDAREGFAAEAPLVQTNVRRGIEGLTQYYQLSLLGSQQLETAFRGALEGKGYWSQVDDVDYRFDKDTQASILTIKGIATVDWDDEGDGRYDLSLPGGGFSPPAKRRRPSNQDADAPYYNAPNFSCYATTVRLPQDTDLKHWHFNTTFDTMLFGKLYYRMIELNDDRTIRMVRGSRVEDSEISAERARKDNGRIDDFDNSKARITYDPDDTAEPWGVLRGVPATYEVDWTGKDAPCLPPDMLAAN